MGGDSPGDNASSAVLRIEHLIIFGLLCMMVMFISRECFNFRRHGLHVIPGAGKDELSVLVESYEEKSD